MFQINYKECKFHKNNLLLIILSCFRLTIRNVNYRFAIATIVSREGFRLTIRNVNYDKARIISKTKTGFRLTIRNVNYGEYHNITVKGFVLD